MDEENREWYLKNLQEDHIRRELEKQDCYSFLLELIDEKGIHRIKKYQLFYISKELERVGMARVDVTDVAVQENSRRQELRLLHERERKVQKSYGSGNEPQERKEK